MKEKNITPQEEERDVAMVECPCCNKAIEVPAKSDVILTCPHCNKELITYDKSPKSQIQLTKDFTDYIKQRKVLKWGKVAAFLCFLIYIIIYNIPNTPDMNAIYIVTESYTAATDSETEKALVQAAVNDDNMKTLEIIGNNRTVLFKQGDRVKITKNVVRGLPDHYRVKRLSDGASALIPYKYLQKE